MIKHRGYILTALLATCGMAAAAGVATYWWSGPMDPATASQGRLFRWLVLNDASSQPAAFQDALIERLVREINTGIDADPSGKISGKYQQQLSQNADYLKHRWFVMRVDQYAELPPEAQSDFLDDQIETVFAWADLEAKWTSEGNTSGSAASFFAEVEGWIRAENDAQLKARMKDAVQASVEHWLATRDLAEQPMATRRLLAMEIVEELEDGLQLESVTAGQASGNHSRLQANGLLLTEAWLHEQAERYYEMPVAERGQFIDNQIANVQRWGVMELVTGDSAAPDDQAAAIGKFNEQVSEWIARAEPEQQPRLKRLMADVQGQIARRTLQQALRNLFP